MQGVEEIRAQIAAIRAEITTRAAELDCLLEKLKDYDEGRPQLTLIKGGRTAGLLAVPLAGFHHRGRNGVGLVAASVAGALALIVVVPAHTTPGAVGGTTSYLSIPAVPPPTPNAGAAPLAPTGGTAAAAPVAAVSALPSASMPTPAATVPGTVAGPVQTPSAGAPSSAPVPSASATASSASVSPSARCLIKLRGTRMVVVCLR